MFPSVVIIGDKNTGKTSLVRCISEDCMFLQEYVETKDINVTSMEIRLESKNDDDDDLEDIIDFVEIPESRIDEYKDAIYDAKCVIVMVVKRENKPDYDISKYTRYLENKKHIVVSSKSDTCGIGIYNDDYYFSSLTCEGLMNITEFIRSCIVEDEVIVDIIDE